MKQWLKNEFITGYNKFEHIFLLAMVLLQVIMYCIVPDTAIGMVCGIAGVICVVLTAKGKISSYVFNFIQTVTYMIICWNAGLYLEWGEQIFCFCACIYGIFAWKKNMSTEQTVIAKKFKWWQWLVVAGVTAVTTIGLGYFADIVLNSTLSYLDAFTVALAIIGQMLMTWRYREQWAMWIIINVTSLVMFTILQNWSMVAMYIAWTINAIYGWLNWTKLSKTE
jgi:nicotinamide mononucleotide transporter